MSSYVMFDGHTATAGRIVGYGRAGADTLLDVALAENLVRAGQAACSYS
jgi:hypothetical protein